MTSRRRRHWQPHGVLSSGAVAAFLGLALLAPNAYAAGTFAVTAHGSADGLAAVMPAGKPPTMTVLQGSVQLDWAPSTFTSGGEVAGYILNRQQAGSTTVTQVCTVAPPFRSCTDSPPAGQQVVYTVVPTAQLWRGPASPGSAPVTIAAALAVVAATASPTPLPTPSPGPTPTPTPTPTATPTPAPTPTASPTATPTPAPS